MCNIAGYVGTRDAAPILIEMMLREEGWAGGYQTGIATIHEGKIYYAKITGDTKRLLEHTDAAHLPGKIGIMHSRSRSGGDDLWAHPFIGTGGHTAYIANGGIGIFSKEENTAARNAIFAELESSGYHSSSRTHGKIGSYPTLPDGTSAHISDIMAQLITRYIDEGLDSRAAMDKAFCTMPSEVVGLMLHDAEPNCITYARINYPMNVGFSDHGAYMATTRDAFPEDARNCRRLTELTSGRVYAHRFTTEPLSVPPCTVAPIKDEIIDLAAERTLEALKEKPLTGSGICDVIGGVFEKADCDQTEPLLYEVITKLTSQGRIGKIVSHNEPGMREGITATRFFAHLAEK